MNFEKPEKSEYIYWRYRFIHVHQKAQSYEVLQFLRYEVRQNFLSFWVIFCVFNPVHPYNPENQNFEELKKAFGNVIILNLCNKKTRCLLTQIWSPCTDIIFCHFRPFFAFLPNYWPQQLRFGKTPGHIILLHMCNINQDMTYSSCGMKFTRHNFFSHLGQFFALLPPNTLKNKNIKNEKTPEDIILSKCTKNHDHLLYTVPEIWHMTDVIIFILGIRHISKHFSTTSKRS